MDKVQIMLASDVIVVYCLWFKNHTQNNFDFYIKARNKRQYCEFEFTGDGELQILLLPSIFKFHNMWREEICLYNILPSYLLQNQILRFSKLS